MPKIVRQAMDSKEVLWLYTSVVDQQLRILTEELVKFVLVVDRASCHIAHREHTVFFELLCDSSSHSPEVSERLMRP